MLYWNVFDEYSTICLFPCWWTLKLFPFFLLHIKIRFALKIFCLLSGHFCETTSQYSRDTGAKWLPCKLYIFKHTKKLLFLSQQNESISPLPKSLNGRCCKSVLKVGVVKNTRASKRKNVKHYQTEVRYWSKGSAVRSVAALSEDARSVPSICSELTTICNSGSKRPVTLFWPPWVFAHEWHTHRGTHTKIQINLCIKEIQIEV